jgi:hypothetical protein
VGDPGKISSTKLIRLAIFFILESFSNTHLANNYDRVEFMQSSSSGVEILEAEEEDRCRQSDGHAHQVLERS